MKVKSPLILTLLLIISLQLSAQKRQQQLEEFGATLSDAIIEQNEAILESLFDMDMFLEKFIIQANSGDLKSFNKGFINAISKTPFLQKFISVPLIDQEGSYDLIRAYYDGKEPHLLFRLNGNDGINYHDLLLTPNGRKSFKVSDIYIYYTGEYISETLRRTYLSIAKDFLSEEKTEGLPSFNMETLNSVVLVKRFMDQGDYSNAAKAMEQINPEIMKEKVFQIMNLTIKSNLNDGAYLEALKEYKASFPDDASGNLISLDYLFINEEYEELLKAVDKLDEKLGGDSYLNLFRANAYYLNNQPDKAEPLFRQLMEEFPYDVEGPFSLLDLFIMGERYEESIEFLYELCDRFDIAEQDMTTIIEEEPTYKRFSESSQFAKWKEDNK